MGIFEPRCGPDRVSTAKRPVARWRRACSRNTIFCMKKLFLIALLGLFAFAAFAADVTGTWKAEVPGRGGNMQQNTFVFKQDGTKLTGTVDGGRGGPAEIVNGKVEGDN